MEQHEVFVEMITKVDGRARSSASQKVRVPAYTNSIAVPRGQVLRVRDRPERKHQVTAESSDAKAASETREDGKKPNDEMKREAPVSVDAPPAKAAKTKGKKGRGKGKSK